MPVKPAIKKLPEEELACIVEYNDAQKDLQAFKEKHKDIFSEYATLVEKRNALLETAEKVVRAMKVSCGPFELYQYRTEINATRLFEELGKDAFIAAGGVIGAVTTYSIEPPVFDASVARNLIPEEVATDAEVVKTSPSYHVPKKITT